MRLILASASPRRAELLRAREWPFRIQAARIAEIAPPHLTPAETVLFNARAKAEEVAARFPEELILGADTLVAFEGEIFGKPSGMKEAFSMVRRMNGRVHEVFSGIWLVHRATNRRRGAVDISRVQFRHLSDARLRGYLDRIAPLDKAGAYAAQDDRGELIQSVTGSLTNVIGLPMEKVEDLLASFGLAATK